MPPKADKDAQRDTKLEEMRTAAAEAENQIRLFRESGGYVPAFDTKDQQKIQAYLKLAAMAKYISKTPVLIKLWRDGKVQILTEPVGNYDDILRILLTRLDGGSSV